MAPREEYFNELMRASAGIHKESIVLAYAVHHGYELEFSSEGTIANLENYADDALFCEAARELSVPLRIRRRNEFAPEVAQAPKKFYEKLKEISKDDYDNSIYGEFVRHRDMCLFTKEADRKLAAELKNLGVVSVFDRGHTSLSLLPELDNNIRYTASSMRNYGKLLIRIASEIYKRDDVSTLSADLFERDQIKDFDAVIFNARTLSSVWSTTESDFLHSFYVENKCKYAFLIIDILTPEYDALKEGHLFKVIDVGGGEEALEKHILVFDMKGSHDKVEYSDGTEVSYEQLKEHHGWINSSLYKKRTVPEGYKEKLLSEVAAVRQVGDVLSSSDRQLPTYHLSRSFVEVASPFFKPQLEVSRGRIWFGQHIHLGRSAREYGPSIYAAISRSSGKYRCDCNLVLDPEPKEVVFEYLAWVLMNDKQFCSLFNIGSSALDQYRIVIAEDLDEQRAIVQRELDKDRKVVNSSGVYNVFIVNGNGLFTPEDIEQIREWNLNVQANLSSVSGTNGLKEALPFAIKEGARVDAILFDASTDAKGTRLKGLQGAFKLGREKKIPVFVFSSIPLDDVRADLEEDDLKYCEKGHLFSSDGEFALKNYITAVRDALDNDGTLGAQLRQQYKSEFKAAEKVDELFDGTTAKDLEKFLSKPNEVLNEVRKSTEGLVRQIAKIISNGSGLEKVDTGLVVRLFQNGYAEDTKGKRKDAYILTGSTGRIMEKTLGTAMMYMWQILDGASHGTSDETVNKLNVSDYLKESNTTNIAMSAIRIYMEFLVWLASTEGKFDVVCNHRDSPYATFHLEDCFGTVVRVSKDEYYVKTDWELYSKIHLGSRGLHEGQRVQVLSISPETNRDFIRKYEWYAKEVSPVDDSTGPSSLD